jgi:cytosine/adenosine deaminase-related metal-dependent hydrolase
MSCINGKILTEQGFKQGYVIVKDEEIPLLHFGNHSHNNTKKAIIIPTFINAHTHIGDTFIRRKHVSLPHDIKKLVAPPYGLKHRYLKNTNEEEILQGMIYGLNELESEGISTFIDFRENGIDGINLLQKALKGNPINSMIFSRPKNLQFSNKEIIDLLKKSDGIGISSIEDYNYDDIALIAELTKKKHKQFALHVSERIQESIRSILDLKPNFIIHMTQSSKKDLEQVKKHDIPIVVCPRSNHFFHMKANLKEMKQTGNTILIGTDNSMVHSLSILQEIRFIQDHFQNLFSIEELFLISTYGARKALNLKDNIPGSKFPSSWILIDPKSNKIMNVLKMVEEG